MTHKQDFRGKKVTVVGLGIEGVDLVRYLVGEGALVTASDARPAERLAPRLRELDGLPVRLSLGENDPADTVAADHVFVSQGVPLDIPALRAARERGVPLDSMMRLFLDLCPGPVVGITGSSGKTHGHEPGRRRCSRPPARSTSSAATSASGCCRCSTTSRRRRGWCWRSATRSWS